MSLEEISLVVDIVLTAATGIMAYATYKMVKSTNESVNEMKLSREETNSAEVVTYFEVDAHRMYFVIENVGKTIAKNVNIEVNPELKDSMGRKYANLKEISYLPPNYKIKTFFDMTHSHYTKFKEYPHIKFIITYKNIYGRIIKREYESDLNYLTDVNFLNSESETVEMSLYKIRKEFHKTNNNLDTIKKEFSNTNKKLKNSVDKLEDI